MLFHASKDSCWELLQRIQLEYTNHTEHWILTSGGYTRGCHYRSCCCSCTDSSGTCHPDCTDSGLLLAEKKGQSVCVYIAALYIYYCNLYIRVHTRLQYIVRQSVYSHCIALICIATNVSLHPVDLQSRCKLAWPPLHCCSCCWTLGLPSLTSALALLCSPQWSCGAQGRVTAPVHCWAQEEGHPRSCPLRQRHSWGSTACHQCRHWGQCSEPGERC